MEALSNLQFSPVSTYRSISVVATGQLIKAAPGKIYHLNASNTGAAVRFLKLYNKATAPTVGTDTPIRTYMLPVGQSINIPIETDPIDFTIGIGIGATVLIADADTTAPGANEVVVNIGYR